LDYITAVLKYLVAYLIVSPIGQYGSL